MFEEYKNNFELCVRVIILNKGKILVCHNKERKYYFFPGGHINFGETAKEALKRELKEELDIKIKNCFFIGAIENVFKEQGKMHHELDLVFNVEAEEIHDKSKEDHISFFFLDMEKFSKEAVFPIALRDNIIKWLKDHKTFWATQVDYINRVKS